MSRLFLTIAAVAASLALGDVAQAQTPPTPATPSATEAPPAKKSKKQTRRQEADKSIQSGTVPKRYMQNVPKEYHHLIPFER